MGRITLSVSAALLAVPTGGAWACPPPIADLTEADRLKPAFDAADAVVYGVVVKGATAGHPAQFRVIHSYKGSLAPGAIVTGPPSHGFDPPPCLDMRIDVPKPKAVKGAYGVIAFRNASPALNFIEPATLEMMFREGWIQRAAGAPTSQPSS